MRNFISIVIMVLAFTSTVFAQIRTGETEASFVHTALIEHLDQEMKLADSMNQQRFEDFEPQDRTFLLEGGLPSLFDTHEIGQMLGRLRAKGVGADSCLAPCRPSSGRITVSVIERNIGQERAILKAVVSGSFEDGDVWKKRVAYVLERGSDEWEVVSESLEWEGLFRADSR